jgi:hypothetical protein
MEQLRRPLALAVLALMAGVVAGCSSPAGAALRAIVAAPDETATPASTAAAATQAPGATDDPDATTWFTHRAGYAMAVPPGWLATAMTSAQVDLVADALLESHPELAHAVREALEASGLRVSMLGIDLSSVAVVPPLVVVLSQPTDGMRLGQVAGRLGEAIATLPGLDGPPARSEAPGPTGVAIRFDFRLEHEGIGAVLVRCQVFRFAGSAYVVAVAASEPQFQAASPTFEAILSSLRFGV